MWSLISWVAFNQKKAWVWLWAIRWEWQGPLVRKTPFSQDRWTKVFSRAFPPTFLFCHISPYHRFLWITPTETSLKTHRELLNLQDCHSLCSLLVGDKKGQGSAGNQSRASVRLLRTWAGSGFLHSCYHIAMTVLRMKSVKIEVLLRSSNRLLHPSGYLYTAGPFARHRSRATTKINLGNFT